MAKVPFKRIRERAAKRKGGEKILSKPFAQEAQQQGAGQARDDRVLSEMAAGSFRRASYGASSRRNGRASRRRSSNSIPSGCCSSRPSSGRSWPRTSASCAIRKRSSRYATTRGSWARSRPSTAASASFWPPGRPTTRRACGGVRQARLTAGRFQRPVPAALPRLGRLRAVGPRAALPARCRRADQRDGTSKKDLRAAQAQLNAWKEESGLPMAQFRASALCRSARTTTWRG